MTRLLATLLLSFTLLTAPAGCAWLSSGTPLATATNGTLDCIKVGATDAAQAAGPILLDDLIRWATGGTFKWSDVLAAFGGLEAIIKDGIAVATCSYDAIVNAINQATAGPTPPAAVALLGRTIKLDDAVKVSRLAQTMMKSRGLRVKVPLAMKAAVVTVAP
jgi:hypothetical protein